MREIKFRAWDKEKKKWFNAFVGDSANILWYEFEDPHKWGISPKLKFEICQFTGLKDKNGKEIYEGYILQYLSLKFPIRADCYHGLRFLFGEDQLTKAFALEGEGIGNIYENPERVDEDKAKAKDSVMRHLPTNFTS